MSNILIVGTAKDGPINDPVTVKYTNVDYILELFGYKKYDSVYINPSTGIVTLSEPMAGNISTLYPQESYILPFDKMFLKGSYSASGGLLLGPLPLTVPVSGWLEYTPLYEKHSLPLAIKQSLSQSLLTPVERIDVLRVTPEIKSNSSLTLGDLTWKYIYPSYNGNNVEIKITSDSLQIKTPTKNPIIYAFSNVPTIGSLMSKVDTDVFSKFSKVSVYANPSIQHITCKDFFLPITGTYMLTGGVSSVNAGVSGYINSLNQIDTDEYDFIVFPGILSRDIFPYLTPFTNKGFPTIFVAAASGKTISEISQDARIHRQFVSVYGECVPNANLDRKVDLSVSVATASASDLNYYSLGSNLDLNLLNADVSAVPDTLVKYGLTSAVLKNGQFKSYRVLSTDTSVRTTATTVTREFLRLFYSQVINCIGKESNIALALAEKILANSFKQLIKSTSPLIDAQGQVRIIDKDLEVAAVFQVTGLVEAIRVQSSIPLKTGVGN